MLEKGADPNVQDREGGRPLYWAAKIGHEGIVKLLLERGANPDMKNNNGFTPLHWAAQYKHEGIVRVLKSAIDLQKKRIEESIIDFLSGCPFPVMTAQEITKPADEQKNAGRLQIKKSFFEAVMQGDLEKISDYLTAKGIPVNILNRRGLTPVHLAAQRGDAKLLLVLLKAGALPHVPLYNQRGKKDALDYAVKQGSVEVILSLVKALSKREHRLGNKQKVLAIQQ